MKISRAGILILLAFTILAATGCSRIIARKDLVDGAKAYKDRKYDRAEDLFRDAISRDPSQDAAQLFLARTLHSQYAADRTRTDKAEEAITQYKKTIEEYKQKVSASSSALNAEGSPCNYSDDEIRRMTGDRKAAFDAFKILGDSYKAVANLLDNLGKADERLQWLQQWGNDESLPACLRAEPYTSLAAKENTCANDITELPAVKKTVKDKDGKQVFSFSKPEKPEDLEALRGCVQRGTDLINKAVDLNQDSDSIWSYKTSLLIQASRLAEMDGKTDERDRLKGESDKAKAKFTELAKAKKEKADAEEARRKAEEAAAEGKKQEQQ